MTARIGIDVGTSAVRVALVEGDAHRTLLGLAQARLPEGAVRDGSLVNSVAAAEALKQCLGQLKVRRSMFSPAKAWVSVAGLRAIEREIDMAFVPDDELDDAVRLQSLDVLPFPVEDALISARRIATSDGDDTARARVLVAAAHRELVEPLVQVIEASGLAVAGVDLASSGLVRALVKETDEDLGAEAVISVGAELTTVVVHEHGEACFVRTVSGGGAGVTRAIARALDVGFGEAERLKLELPATLDDLESVRLEMLTALRDGATELLAAVRSSLDYYAALPGRSEVRRVLLTGGGTLLPGLLERFRLQVRAPVVVADCFEQLGTDHLDATARALERFSAVAVGMALKERKGQRRTDLLPKESRTRRDLLRAERAVVIGAAAIGLVLVGLGGLRLTQVLSAERTAGSLTSSISRLQAQIPQYDQVARQHDAVVADASLATPIVAEEVNWPAVLDALRADTPGSISASGFAGSATAAPGSTGAVTTASRSSQSSDTAIATIDLDFVGAGYPSFQAWFDAMSHARDFRIVQYSGLSSASRSVDFTAEIAVTRAVHSDRLSDFEETQP